MDSTLSFRPDLTTLRPFKCNDVGGILPWRLYRQDTADSKLSVICAAGDTPVGLSMKKEKATNDASGLGYQADLIRRGDPLWVETIVQLAPGDPLTTDDNGMVKKRTAFDATQPFVGVARSITAAGGATQIVAFDPGF